MTKYDYRRRRTSRKIVSASRKNGRPICEVQIASSYGFENKLLIEGEIAVVISNLPPLRSKDDFDLKWRNDFGKYNALIDDFILTEEIRERGVGSFIWHKIFWELPTQVRENLLVRGTLASEDASPQRDRLWKKLIDFENNSEAYFRANKDGKGSFKGKIHDVGKSFDIKLNVIDKT